MAPFARWVLHGADYEIALEKTLKAILDVFPGRETLQLTVDRYLFTSIPAEEPWVIRTLIKAGYTYKKPRFVIHGPVLTPMASVAYIQASQLELSRGTTKNHKLSRWFGRQLGKQFGKQAVLQAGTLPGRYFAR
jgi:hypothetical protein